MNERFKFKAVVKGSSIESDYRIVLSNVTVFVTGHIGIGLEGLAEQIKEQYPNISIKELDGLTYYFFKKRPFGGNDHLGIKPEVILQCTGLVDKTNNLIYEGDILRHNGKLLIVKYQEEMACFAPQHFHIENDKIVYCGREWFEEYNNEDCKLYTSNSFEVIGNIYLNPEKLEFNSHIEQEAFFALAKGSSLNKAKEEK